VRNFLSSRGPVSSSGRFPLHEVAAIAVAAAAVVVVIAVLM
jgi:hypothetical protein